MRKFNLMILLFFSLVLIGNSFASVEMFSNYDSILTFKPNNILDISKHISIQNIHTVGIVPGRVEFNINRDDGLIELFENSLKVTDKYGSNIKHKLIKTKNKYVVIVDIFTPILPGFKYDINLVYSMKFNPSGFLFKSVAVPLKENSEIPIKNGKLKIILENNKRFTYSSIRDDSVKINKNTLELNYQKNTPNILEFEYSRLPIDIFHFKGSYVFLISLNIILLLLLIFEVKKEFVFSSDKSKKSKKLKNKK